MGPKIGCIILFTGTWAYDLTGGGGGGEESGERNKRQLLNPLKSEMKPS